MPTMATRAPWDSNLFLLAILGYLAFNLYHAVVQSRDGAEVAFWLLSYFLQLRLFRSIRRFAVARAGSPESNRACDSAVSLALFLLVFHSWKVLRTWLVFAAIFLGFSLLLNV